MWKVWATTDLDHIIEGLSGLVLPDVLQQVGLQQPHLVQLGPADMAKALGERGISYPDKVLNISYRQALLERYLYLLKCVGCGGILHIAQA